MKLLWSAMVIVILLLQARLWVGEGSFAQVWSLQETIADQRAENAQLALRNERLFAEVDNLRSAQGAIEERARKDLGLIRNDETFFLVVE